MLFTIFCCISTGLCVFCILNRVHKRSIEIAVRLAVREVEKEYESKSAVLAAKLNSKEGELKTAVEKTQQLKKLHEIVPPRPSAPPAATAAAGAKVPSKDASAAKLAKDKLKREGLEMFAMSRPFTDTSYDALLAATEVVKVEPKAI